MTHLDLSFEYRGDLPSWRGLTNLTSLDISFTRVSDISTLRELTALTSLDLSHTQVSDLSPLSELTALTTLDISFTKVSNLSPLSELTALNWLIIRRTEISDLSPLRALTSLVALTAIATKISDLSPLRELPSLTALLLPSTPISDLSPLRELTSLTALDITDTKVSDLSPLEHLLIEGQLQELYVSGESLRAQPPELALSDNPAEAFRSYFMDLRAGSRRNTDLKLVLIGNGHVGKTTLKRHIVTGELPQEGAKERTHGIDATVLPWRVDGEDFRVTVWDLAGQEIYHTMHRFLLHPRALFLLLWAEETDETDPQELHPVSYWLELVRQLGEGGVTILVKNQIDRSNRFGTRPPELTGAEIPVAAEVAVSATNGTGISALRETVSEQIQRSRDRWGYLLPSSWLAVRDDVERLRSSGHRDIPFAQFEQLCTAHGTQQSRVLAEYLNESGFLFYHAGFFGDRLVLHQNWLLEKIYAVFDPRQRVRDRVVHAGGEITSEDADWVWPGHEAEERQVFLDFLTTSELAFGIETLHSRSYVVPALLPAEAPPFRPGTASGDLWLELRYRVLHRALIERLIVRLSGLSPHRQWWRYGIDIKARDGSWEGSLEAPPGANILRIHIHAPPSSPQPHETQWKAAASLLSLVEGTLPGASPDIAASTDGMVFVDLDHLTRARAEGRSHCTDLAGDVYEAGRFAQLPLRADLERLKSEDLHREAPTMNVDVSKVKIFVSYAHKDEDHKSELMNRLKVIQRSCPIEFWDDRQLFAGTLVDEEIMARLNAADMTCLLISPSFMASDYCWTKEMASALEQYERHGKVPVPIIVRKTPSWQEERIGKHLALPKDGRPLSEWKDPDDFWGDVETGLRRLIHRELERKAGKA